MLSVRLRRKITDSSAINMHLAFSFAVNFAALAHNGFGSRSHAGSGHAPKSRPKVPHFGQIPSRIAGRKVGNPAQKPT